MNLKQKKKPKVLVVAHDAGGAELIAAYMQKYARRYEFHSYVEGLAARIFKREGIAFKRAPRDRSGMARVMDKNRDVKYALMGTGWMTAIEAHACREAKLQGIKACMYLDSWMNYRGRFGYPKRGWQKRLPDEFWVGDSYALALAKHSFPKTPVRLVPNQYLAAIIARYKMQEHAIPSERHILFTSAAGKTSERIFADFLANLSHRKSSKTVLVRLHPADKRSLYKDIIRKESHGIHVELSLGKDIVDDFSRASVVVGPETVALVPAAMLGLRTIRIVPKGESPFLPFPKILRVKSAKDAVREIDV